MQDFIQQTLQRFPSDGTWIARVREQGKQLWKSQLLPTRKTEAWKYTNIKPLEAGNYFATGLHTAANDAIHIANLSEFLRIPELNSIDLVFVDGVYQSQYSNSIGLPKSLDILRFADADPAQAQEIETQLCQVIETVKHPFAALNTSQMMDGLFIKVSANAKIELPVRVVWLNTRQAQAFSVAPRLLVVLENGAEATVIEHFISTDEEQNSFVNGVSEFNIQANANLRHYRLHLEQENTIHIGGVHANLAAGATLNSFNLALGSLLKRIDFVVNHRGSGAHSELNGVYLPRNKQHVDFHTCIEHRVPHCTSNENFRGIIADSARAVFNGRIHIHRDAQKTAAHLSNKNLLTSNKAEVDTKPELEIYADDVQCAHGATVAQLDANSLHYLRTRGISAEEAKVILGFGFINALLCEIRDPGIAEYLRPHLRSMLSSDPQLARHLL